MPIFEYRCPENGQNIEVIHHFNLQIKTWGELCELAEIDPGATDESAQVVKQISSPSLAFPKTNAELKNLGFTKLVKREQGVYENVTATGNEKRYMKPDDPSSLPHLKNKISD